MTDEKVIKRLKKLMALAEQGVGGERENAERMLQATLDKYCLTIDDLVEDVKKPFLFEYHGPEERTLLMQTLAKVLQVGNIKYSKGYRCKTKISFMLTPSEAIEISFVYQRMVEAWKKESKAFFNAFIHKQNLYAPGNADDSGPSPSQEEIEDMLKKSRAIDPVSLNKAIEHK